MSFDSEYLKEFGEWDPQQPYGYASHDVHVMARIEGRVVGHVWARREIAVGTETVAMAGVGGLLISDEPRGRRLGRELMGRAAQSMRDRGHLAFGYLGCREQVVPFYESCRWKRIVAREGRSGVMANPSWTSLASRSLSGRPSRRSSCDRKATSTCADGLGSR